MVATREITDDLGLAGSVLDGKFRVEEAVADGGFGKVYRGTHLTLDRPVAIKVLKCPPDLGEKSRAEWIERFGFEARTVARLRHPCVVQVLEHGVSAMPSGESLPWMALEWIDGQTLAADLRARRMKGRARRTPAEALTLLRSAFEAIAQAHDQGVAHRDLKPGNLMLTVDRRGTIVRVLDFGIAKIMEAGEQAGSGSTSTASTLNAFTPWYAAPEQIGHTRTGVWTDVYALGLILTEVLTGRPPYDGDDNTLRYADALSFVRPTPAKRGVDVGRWEAVIARAVSIRPEARHANAGDLLADLEQTLPDATPAPAAGPRAPESPSVALAAPDASPDADADIVVEFMSTAGSSAPARDPATTLASAVGSAVVRGGSSRSRVVAIAAALALSSGLLAVAYTVLHTRADVPDAPRAASPTGPLRPTVITPVTTVEAPGETPPADAALPTAPPSRAPAPNPAPHRAAGHHRRATPLAAPHPPATPERIEVQ